MAQATFKASINNDRSVTVARSTDNNGTSSAATLIFDNTLDKHDVNHAVRALTRALRRLFAQSSSPADVPTNGSSVE